jgi:hypothetical protein
MSKGELEKIIKKLENNKEFIKIYNVSLEKEWSDSFFIKVKRKERQMGDKLVYSADVFDNYIVNFCFEVRYSKGFLGDVLSTYPIRDLSDNIKYYKQSVVGLKGTEIHYQTIYLTGEVDVDAIMKYIANTEWYINEKHNYETTFIPSNGFLCEKCQCQISKSAY